MGKGIDGRLNGDMEIAARVRLGCGHATRCASLVPGHPSGGCFRGRGASPPASLRDGGLTISGVVSEDLDGDRVLGPGDRGAFGPVIDLERRVDGEVAWVVSLYGDGDGRFAFTDVPPGDYVGGGLLVAPLYQPSEPGGKRPAGPPNTR